MTSTDYILDIALIAVVLLQIRGRRLTFRSFLIPLVIVAWAASEYLKGIPTAGNDLLLVGLGTLAGAVLGAGCALSTKLSGKEGGPPVAKAGVVAAVLWVLGVGTRFAFQLYATHGGGPSIVRFSIHHHITSMNAWTACLILMALAEVVLRMVILAVRARPLGLFTTETDSSSKAFSPARAHDWQR